MLQNYSYSGAVETQTSSTKAQTRPCKKSRSSIRHLVTVSIYLVGAKPFWRRRSRLGIKT